MLVQKLSTDCAANLITSMVFMFCIESIYTQEKKDLEFKLELSVLGNNFVRLRGSPGEER